MEQEPMGGPSALGGRRCDAPPLSRVRRRVHLLLLTLGGIALSWSVGCSVSRRMIFPGSRTPLPATGSDPFPGAQVVEWTSEDGNTLRGLLARAPGTDPRPALVYFHGNAESAGDNLDLARLLSAAGLDVLVAEYRGYGDCEGSPSEEGLLRDARGALATAARELGRPEAELVLVGRSLGTGVAARLASEGHGAALALISPYTSIYEMACRIAPRPLVWLAVHDRFESLEHLRDYHGPLLVLHGTADEVIPFAMGEELARAREARFVPLPGVGHNDVFHGPSRQVILEELQALARRGVPAR